MSSNVHARFNIKLIFNTIRANLDAPLIDRWLFANTLW